MSESPVVEMADCFVHEHMRARFFVGPLEKQVFGHDAPVKSQAEPAEAAFPAFGLKLSQHFAFHELRQAYLVQEKKTGDENQKHHQDEDAAAAKAEAEDLLSPRLRPGFSLFRVVGQHFTFPLCLPQVNCKTSVQRGGGAESGVVQRFGNEVE